ncbi:hypothetical protein L798_06926 [Zootermopsis nevadensis]|uniref:Uncharacterized protein n=1 Tax=Zootermopsis nevadensis TaxID=136037 RepID=A0A067R4L1_ZOONE|nr:hypothetical protein L798_06926 [Zootermopsis nevadensis]
MNMEQWWKNMDRKQQKDSKKKPVPPATLSPTNYTRTDLGTNPGFQSEKLVTELWYGSVFAFGECITRNNCGLGTDKTFPLFSSRAPCAKNTQKRISDPLLELI